MGMCAVGRFMKIWGQRDSDACSRCGELEDSRYVWICKHEGAQAIWKESLDDLQKWMDSVNTNSALVKTILEGLSIGYGGENVSTTGKHLALLQQNDLGWGVAIEGWWSFEWANTQNSFYCETNSNRTGRRWMISLIKRVWQIA